MNKMAQATATRVFRDPVLFLAFGFGAGLAPKAPGTFGTVAALPLYFIMVAGGDAVYWGALILVCVGGIWICGRASHSLGVHDHGGIVWDEIAGFLIAMLPASSTWQAVLAGFVLFRVFDIFKPWPIRLIDRKVHGGLGIMLDDIVAGGFAAGVLTAFGAFGIIS